VIKRKCLICGKEIKIKLNKDRTYSNGSYFGRVKGKEYWECDNCSIER
jgi:hypothetical protein